MNPTAETPNIYTALLRHTHAVLGRGDQKEEAHLTCPACGHASSPRSPHCSFSPRGWKCFVCGAGGGLQDLANRVGLQTGTYIPPIIVEQPVRQLDTPRWMDMSVATRLLHQWEHHPQRLALWKNYKALPDEIIFAKRLGVGKLPAYSSKCQGDRLIVPVFDKHGQLVGIRGRYLGCACCNPKSDKWLVAKGTTPERMPLYNADALTKGATVCIVENPIDALILSVETPHVGVASYSTSYWQDRWTETLRQACPHLIVVIYDNDLVGNGGSSQRPAMTTAWKATHNNKVPASRGVKLANHLLQTGLPAVLYNWAKEAPAKADVGSLHY